MMKKLAFQKPILRWSAKAILWVLMISRILNANEKVEIHSFTLPIWESSGSFTLSEQAAGIIILDFFAYWCIPCLPTSQDLEHNISNFYLSKNGNPQGLPVQVLSINVEAKQRQRTADFIKKSGASLVLDDPSGVILARLGGLALPYLVVLKGEAHETGTRWTAIYQHSGYEGTEAMRTLIDSIGKTEAIQTQAGVPSS